jgi:hypothetical protein
MNHAALDPLTPRHLALFGAVVQWFARYETLMEAMMAAAAGCDVPAVMLLMRSHSFSGKRQTLLDLLRHRATPMDNFDRIRSFLAIPDNLARLRADICHCAWRGGAAPDGVQPNWILRVPPSVKPSHGEEAARDAATSAAYVEDEDEQVEYTIDDLQQIVASLAENYALFAGYLKEIDFLAARR